MTFKYLDSDIPTIIGEESAFDLIKYDGQFSQVPQTINTAQNTATTTGVSSFSDWLIFSPTTPTAAPAVVSGRVKDSYGRGISNAVVSLLDGNGRSRSARTNSFGYFNVQNVPTGESYVLTVSHLRYSFESALINVNENVSGLEIVALP